MAWPAVAAIGAGIGAKFIGDQQQAKATGKAAQAQQAHHSQAIDLANATPQEMIAYERMLNSALGQLAERERMIQAIDPALMEASQQVLSLLRGDEAGMTQVMNKQRQRQREQLVNQLRAQYGPGADTSSVGRRALDEFDSQTALVTQQAQSSALGEAFQIAGSAAQLTDRSGALASLGNAGQLFGGIQQRRVNTQLGTASSAGAQYVGPGLQAQAFGQLGSSIAGFGGMMYGQQQGQKPPVPGEGS